LFLPVAAGLGSSTLGLKGSGTFSPNGTAWHREKDNKCRGKSVWQKLLSLVHFEMPNCLQVASTTLQRLYCYSCKWLDLQQRFYHDSSLHDSNGSVCDIWIHLDPFGHLADRFLEVDSTFSKLATFLHFWMS